GDRVFTVPEGAAAIDLDLPASISGTGSLSKDGAGTTQLGGFNSYTGTTSLHNGTLLLNSFQANAAVPHDLVIGDGVGAESSAVVRLGQSGDDEIADSAAVTVNSDGLLDLA